MLTKEHLSFHTKKGKILPKLIDTDDKKNLGLADEFLVVFKNCVGFTREKLEECTSQILEKYSNNSVVAKGLEKLLFDRTEFDTESKEEFINLRKKVFYTSSKILSETNDSDQIINEKNNVGNFKIYKNEISEAIGIPLNDLIHRIYGDLPSFQKVLRFRDISSVKLLHKYNCAQVQGLLLRCEKITVSLPDSHAASLRQLLKYLRFNKLLVRISRTTKKNKTLVLVINGPLSMFMQTQKYGFNLAKFFPAILHQSIWKLDAEVRIRKNLIHYLHLDQTCGIQSYYKQFLDYVPDEIELFSKKLTKKMPNWQISTSADYIHLTGESLCFPDFKLTHSSGKSVSMELFHTWHSAPLIERLKQLEKINRVPLIIGINNNLLAIKGSIPGKKNTTVFIKDAIKGKN